MVPATLATLLFVCLFVGGVVITAEGIKQTRKAGARGQDRQPGINAIILGVLCLVMLLGVGLYVWTVVIT